jgi:hypothetical protein
MIAHSKFKFRTFWRRTASGTAGIFSPRRSVVMWRRIRESMRRA